MQHATHPHPNEFIEAQLQDLARLRAMAMAIAEAAAAQTLRQLTHTADAATAALPPIPQTPLIDPDRAFPRIARCVRLTIMLEHKLRHAHLARPTLPRYEQARLDRRRESARDKATDIVDIHFFDAERRTLAKQVKARLDEREMEDLLENTPTDQIALKICQELGVPCDPAIWPPAVRRAFSDTALELRGIPVPPPAPTAVAVSLRPPDAHPRAP